VSFPVSLSFHIIVRDLTRKAPAIRQSSIRGSSRTQQVTQSSLRYLAPDLRLILLRKGAEQSRQSRRSRETLSPRLLQALAEYGLEDAREPTQERRLRRTLCVLLGHEPSDRERLLRREDGQSEHRRGYVAYGHYDRPQAASKGRSSAEKTCYAREETCLMRSLARGFSGIGCHDAARLSWQNGTSFVAGNKQFWCLCTSRTLRFSLTASVV
jgi:hypothetical protein